MSTWTHVNIALRVDGIPAVAANKPDLSNPPEGSEGPLQFNIHEYDTGLPWLAVHISGDLRDFDESEVGGIIEWLTKATEECMMRSGIAEIETEGNPAQIWVCEFDGDGTRWKRLELAEVNQ